MNIPLLPPLACPECKGSVHRLPRDSSADVFFLACFADIPFWILFAMCGTLGMKNIPAGVVATGLTGFAYFAWYRVHGRYRCPACTKTFKYSEVVRS
jgi:uncharacterized protein YbaR (Trm112 family)